MNTKTVKEPARTLVIDAAGHKHEINFPNAGELIDIEANKALYSQGQYGAMVRSRMKSSDMALLLIEMASTFSVLIPKLEETLRIDSIFQLSLIEIKPLTDAYQKVYLPWYNEWMEILNYNEPQSDSVEEPTSTTSEESKDS